MPNVQPRRPVSEHLPVALRAARAAADLTTAQVAAEVTRLTGVHCGSAQIELHESGRLVPSVEGLRALADALGTSMDALAGRHATS
jgi:transcriptional regulator with XRE-family HTH domain